MKPFIVIIVFLLMTFTVFGQNLMSERIRKIDERKKSLYFEKGVFHNGAAQEESSLKAVRHSYSSKQGFERVVFDFATPHTPKVYGHISPSEKKLYLDLFKTSISNSVTSFGNSKYVKTINFYPLDKESLSVEILFKERVSMDIFQLGSHGRLVVDIKK